MKRSLVLFFTAAALCILCACGVNEAASAAVIVNETASPAPTAAPTPRPTATPAPTELYGVRVRWDDEEIDLRDIKIEDAGAEVSEALPSLPRVRRVDMTGCGLTDEEMAALQEAFPDVTFVWTLRIYVFFVPSDTDYFITNPDAGFKTGVYQQGPRGLYYLRDIRSLDLGHCHMSEVPFVANMPRLRHLILADNLVYDISPVENLKELEWLELFNTAVQDPTPLLGCTALRDLNVCYIGTPPDALFETLSQMTWLRRLWCTGTYMSDAQIEALREALPDTEVWCSPGDESTGGTWRYDEDYYDMRDAFHMYYMDIKGNTVERMTEDELAAVLKKYWGY